MESLNRPAEKLPDPWLFDSEALLRELDRCRELVIQIPVSDPNATHFGINIALDAIWNLQQNLRYLLHLHRDGQRQFSRRATERAASRASVLATGSGTLTPQMQKRGRTGRPRNASSAA